MKKSFVLVVMMTLVLVFLSSCIGGKQNVTITKGSEDVRLLLVSSDVRESGVLAQAAADGVITLRYDARAASLDSLLAKIKRSLRGRRADSIAIATHDMGSGKFYLCGSQTISVGSTLQSGEQRRFWEKLGAFVKEEGRIDILACKLAAAPEGRMLLSSLEELSGVAVAASTDDTGNPALGGNWLLESRNIDLTGLYFNPDELGRYQALMLSQVKKLLADDGAGGDQFGYSVSISGDTAIVGACYDDDKGTSSGSAYIFERNEGGADKWGQKQKLLAFDGAAIDLFGYSVSISGDTAIVGAILDDDNGTNSGSVYIFYRHEGGADNWGFKKKLLASDGAQSDWFGESVSISGDTAIVGAWFDDDNGSDSGSAYVFERNEGGADNWDQMKKLLAFDGAQFDEFGSSVSISGDTAIVDAPYDDDNGLDSGSAYIFYRNEGGANNWGQVKKLLASDGAQFDEFGSSVSISGDTAIVGAIYDDDMGGNSGSAYVFYRNEGGADNWGQKKKLLAGDGSQYDYFGFSVSISGDTVIVGAIGDDNYTGSAYIFERNEDGADNWVFKKKLLTGDGARDDNFGSVALSGDTAIVGAFGDDDNGSNSGSAYIFAVTGSITVTAPNGGETWLVGSSQTITWTTTGTVGDVIIEYSSNNGGDWIEIIASTTNDGSHTFTVPDDVSGQCLVRVSETDGDPTDTSNAVFSIIPVPDITVTSPNGGENWLAGTPQTITWTTTGTVGNVRIEFSANNGGSWSDIISSTANGGSYPWTVPGTLSSQCLVRVSETDGDPTDTSNAVFSIIPIPAVTVTSPNGGEDWKTGSSQTITWTSVGAVGDVKIEYSTDNGGSWTDIIDSTSNDGSHPWTLPAAVSDQCLVRVSETDGSPTDTSDAVFSISGIVVTSPNGGEVWHAGKTRQITWDAVGVTHQLKISLWQNGVPVGIIARINDLNARSYSWIVGDYEGGKTGPGTGFTIKIKERDTLTADESDASFSVIKKNEVTSPDGGETWLLGTTRNITWNVPDTFNGSLAIVLLKDSIKIGNIALISYPSSGSYSWPVGKYDGGTAAPGTGYKIKIKKVGTTDFDVSDAPFEIKKFNGLLSPNGGENLLIGTTWDITWKAPANSGLLKISLWKDGVRLGYIAGNIDPASGSYTWTVGDYASGTAAAGKGYKIKIEGIANSDVSDTTFDLSD